VIGGIGVAGIGTALVLGGLVLGRKSTVEHHCDSKTRTCDQPGLNAASSGATLSTVSTVSFAIGAAATAVGAYVVLTSKEGPKTTMGAATTPSGGLLWAARQF
jgi:hypothetical protein